MDEKGWNLRWTPPVPTQVHLHACAQAQNLSPNLRKPAWCVHVQPYQQWVLSICKSMSLDTKFRVNTQNPKSGRTAYSKLKMGRSIHGAECLNNYLWTSIREQSHQDADNMSLLHLWSCMGTSRDCINMICGFFASAKLILIFLKNIVWPLSKLW